MTPMEKDLDSERRRHPRFNIDLPVKYDSRYHLFSKNGRTINASEGGLLVSLPEEIAVGQRFPLRLFFVLILNWISLRHRCSGLDRHSFEEGFYLGLSDWGKICRDSSKGHD